jgi:3-oxoacid CoA-transferase subunit B
VVSALTREQLAERVARELTDGTYVSLGVGLPSLIPAFISDRVDVTVHSNGALGVASTNAHSGADDGDPRATGRVPVASYFDSADSFGIVRGGHLDIAVLGAFQVSAQGDLASWTIPGRTMKGMGGAMDLAYGAKRVIVMMEHVTGDGSFKIVNHCTLPLTGQACVDRIITDLAVIDVEPSGLVLKETAPGVSVDEVLSSTEPGLRVALDAQPGRRRPIS